MECNKGLGLGSLGFAFRGLGLRLRLLDIRLVAWDLRLEVSGTSETSGFKAKGSLNSNPKPVWVGKIRLRSVESRV